jgi:hypothetical protein
MESEASGTLLLEAPLGIDIIVTRGILARRVADTDPDCEYNFHDGLRIVVPLSTPFGFTFKQIVSISVRVL